MLVLATGASACDGNAASTAPTSRVHDVVGPPSTTRVFPGTTHATVPATREIPARPGRRRLHLRGADLGRGESIGFALHPDGPTRPHEIANAGVLLYGG